MPEWLTAVLTGAVTLVGLVLQRYAVSRIRVADEDVRRADLYAAAVRGQEPEPGPPAPRWQPPEGLNAADLAWLHAQLALADMDTTMPADDAPHQHDLIVPRDGGRVFGCTHPGCPAVRIRGGGDIPDACARGHHAWWYEDPPSQIRRCGGCERIETHQEDRRPGLTIGLGTAVAVDGQGRIWEAIDGVISSAPAWHDGVVFSNGRWVDTCHPPRG